MQLTPEMALVRAAKAGDMAAFEQLVRLHQGRVFRIAQNIMGSREDAEEIAQESFLKAYVNLGRFEERSRFSTWLTRIAVNTALMELRRRRGYKVVSLGEDEADESGVCAPPIADWWPNPEQLYGRSELQEILARTLNRLSPHQRTVFLLRDVEELSTEETAEMLNLSISAVKACLLRARLRLRDLLSQYFGRDERPTGAARCPRAPSAVERRATRTEPSHGTSEQALPVTI